MQQEQLLLNEGDAQVTTHRVVIDGTMYAIANITSLRQGQEKNPVPAILAVAFLLLTFFAYPVLDLPMGAAFTLLISIVCAIRAFTISPTHWLRLSTSGVETQALISDDGEFVARVAHAIHHAISMR